MALIKGNDPHRERLPALPRKPAEPAPSRPQAAPKYELKFRPRPTPALAPRSSPAVQEYNRRSQEKAHAQAQANAVFDMYNNMARRQKVAELRQQREARDRKETATALTQKQWEAFSPLQQAATQANADLAGAIQRDIADSTKHNATTAQIQTYMDEVEDLFGENDAFAANFVFESVHGGCFRSGCR